MVTSGMDSTGTIRCRSYTSAPRTNTHEAISREKIVSDSIPSVTEPSNSNNSSITGEKNSNRDKLDLVASSYPTTPLPRRRKNLLRIGISLESDSDESDSSDDESPFVLSRKLLRRRHVRKEQVRKEKENRFPISCARETRQSRKRKAVETANTTTIGSGEKIGSPELGSKSDVEKTPIRSVARGSHDKQLPQSRSLQFHVGSGAMKPFPASTIEADISVPVFSPVRSRRRTVERV